jgi:glycosyltransferase involved in cell wall biosynthesis
MATGRAVVCSRVGQITSLIRDGENGILVPPGDSRALAGALRRLADSPELCRKLGAEAAGDTQSLHTWKHRATEILEGAGALLQGGAITQQPVP